MSSALRVFLNVAEEVGLALIVPLIDALRKGDAERAANAARIVAETYAARRAIREARTRGGKDAP